MPTALVACEFSGRVRDALLLRGVDAVSCDWLPTESDGPHYCGDVRDILTDGWDLLVAHPPGTYLSGSGARWWPQRQQEQEDALAFVRLLADAPIERMAIENPIGRLSTAWRKPDQIVQPWWFGDGMTKATCWWLKNLPPLRPTNVVSGRAAMVHRMPPSPDRSKKRSLTPLGMANAIAEQWGLLL